VYLRKCVDRLVYADVGRLGIICRAARGIYTRGRTMRACVCDLRTVESITP
jgi:hypothetical protein